MTKKTLEEKIKQVGFWTFGGICGYLVIAFFLKSSYPIYEYNLDRSIAYDVIKDALTLAAAFLAPVAAFVLFSDWRVQHREKVQESFTSEIYFTLESTQLKIRQFTEDFMNAYDRDIDFYNKVDEELMGIIKQSQELLVMSKNLVDTNNETTDFMKLAIKVIQKKIPRVISSIEFEIKLQKMKEFPKEMGVEHSEEISEIALQEIRAYPVVFEQHIGDKLFEIEFDLIDLGKLRTRLVV